MLFLFFFILLLPLSIYIYIYISKYNIFKILYFIQFLCFYSFLLIYFILYSLFCFIWFFYKNLRFYRYYYAGFKSSKYFFNRLSIYFSFWRFLCLSIIKQLYIIIFSLVKKYCNKFFFFLKSKNLYFIYIFSFYFKFKIKIFKIYLIVYQFFLLCYQFIYHFFNLDEFANVQKIFRTQFYEDPFFFRNDYMKFPFFFFNLYPFTLIFLKIKQLNFSFFSSLFNYIYIRFFFYFKNLSYLLFIKKVWQYNYYLKFKSIFFLIWYWFGLFIKFICFHFIYIVICFFIWSINLFLEILYKMKWILFYIILSIIIINYFWIFNYFFYFLYKHYMLYLPIFNIKHNLRFFDFIWIDFRNYINLINLHNTLVDVSFFNNTIYNEMLANLNLHLKNYSLKFTEQCGLYTYYLASLWKLRNNDTHLLESVLNGYNKIKNYKQSLYYQFLLDHYMDWIQSDRYDTLTFQKYVYEDDDWLIPDLKRQYLEENLEEFKDLVYNTELFDQVLPVSKETKNQINYYLYYYTGFLRKKFPETCIRLQGSTFLRLKHIPIQFIILRDYKPDWENYYKLWYHTDAIIQEYEKKKYLWLLVYVRKFYKYGITSFWSSFNYQGNKFFLLKSYFLYDVHSIYNKYRHSRLFNWLKENIWDVLVYYYPKSSPHFMNYKHPYWDDTLFWKWNIPSYNWTETKQNHLISPAPYYDPIVLGSLPEDYSHEFLRTVPASLNCLNIRYHYNYIYTMYPYKLYNLYDHAKLINYADVIYSSKLDTMSKITKKYYYLKYNRWSSCNFYNWKLLEDFNQQITIIFQKLYLWNESFLCNYLDWPKNFNIKVKDNKKLNRFNFLNFWDYYYYMNCNKYYMYFYDDIYKKKPIVNLYFIQRFRKDIYHIRQLFLRLISVFLYYKRYKWIFSSAVYSVHHDIKEVEEIQAKIKKAKKKNLFKPTLKGTEDVFDQFKYMWYLNLYLTTERNNILYSNSLNVYIKVFINNYKNYFTFPLYFNNYYFLYQRKITFYRLMALRKINDLKRFIFIKNKKLNGYSLFNYLRSFSFKYHINHLLWHSPYSFLLFKFKENINFFTVNQNFNLFYFYHNDIIEFENYSYIFNLFLNIFEIKNSWIICMLSHSNIELSTFYFNSYYYYYNYGHHNYLNLNTLDSYRIFISLLFQYYNNFLLKLSRYSFIITIKQYTIKQFFLFYFNVKLWFKYLYWRYRFQLYRFQFWGVWIKRAKLNIFKPKNHYAWRANKKELIPFWFIFEHYIKAFIYFLVTIYYTKLNFIYWWFNYRLNYNLLVYIYLKFFEYLYNNKAWVYYYKCIIWYNNLNFNFHIAFYQLIFLKLNGLQINFSLINYYHLILKIYFFIINFKMSLNFKNFLYYKKCIFNLIRYYFSLLFKIRNKFAIFKPNYYYFRIHKGEKMAKKNYYWKVIRNLYVSSFKRTSTRRHMNSFWHFTKNFYFFKNLYIYNFNNYMYIYNLFDLPLNLNFIFFSFWNPLIVLRYNLINFIILWFFIYFCFILSIWFIKNQLFSKSNIQYKYKYFRNVNLYLHFKNTYYCYFNYLFTSPKLFKQYYFYNFMTKDWYKVYQKRYYQLGELITYDEHDKWWKETFKGNFLKKYFDFIKLTFKTKNKRYAFYSWNIMNTKNLSFWFIYFIIMIPWLFIEYILWKLHWRGTLTKKRRFVILLKLFVDNFKCLIKLNCLIGSRNVFTKFKLRAGKNYYNHNLITRRKRIRCGFLFKWDRFKNLYVKLSPLGPYYYWFAQIDKVKYYIDCNKFFFNTIYFSIYYSYIIPLYVFCIYYLYKFYTKWKIYNISNKPKLNI